jgi:hypothetical protein
MIRTVLASPWLPLLYWTAAIIATIWGTHQELKRRPRPHQVQMVSDTSLPTPAQIQDDSFIERSHPSELTIAAAGSRHFWYPRFSVLRKSDSSSHQFLTASAPNEVISRETPSAARPPITMLSIRFDPLQNAVAKTLAIQCRTTLAFSNVQGRTVPIHGVVTQEVVSSTGKILIMAGSRVVGSGRLDPENGRFKSEGSWSIFFDDTEMQVQAQLLDRPEGLPGILGQEPLNENEDPRREASRRDGRFIMVPRNAPFVLDIRGEIQLRDLRSKEASN